MKKNLILGLLISVFFGSSLVIAADAEKAIKYRRGVFNVMGWNFGSMAAMVKGKIPFDANLFARNAEIVAFMSQLPLEGFVEGSDEGDTKARSEIWLNMEDFEAKMKKMQKEVSVLAEISKKGNFDASKSQLKEVGATCKGCHDDYRNK